MADSKHTPAVPPVKRLQRRARRTQPFQLEPVEAPTSFTGPAGRFALLGLACLAATAVLWARFGSIPVTVDGPGMLRTSPSSLAAPGGGPLAAVISFPMDCAGRIRPGMKARVSPAGVSRRAYGELVGEVVRVGSEAGRRQGAHSPDEHPDEACEGAGRPRTGAPHAAEVLIRLRPDPQAPGRYRWTFSKGPPGGVSVPAACTATVVVAEERPWDVWREALARRLGAYQRPDAGREAK